MNRGLPDWLAERLARPLPGPMVGSRFEPRPRLWRHYDWSPPGARQAAVLLLVYPHEDRWHVPLTLRPQHLPAHGGQVSLPGGAVDPGETGRQAAVREFHEELGGIDEPIRVLGSLSPIYVHASNFRVEPWVGAADHRPAMTPNPAEVAELLEVPLGHLADPAHLDRQLREDPAGTYEVPFFLWQSHRIWGATCMILGEFITLLEEFGTAEL